jgi:hypothetical protein
MESFSGELYLSYWMLIWIFNLVDFHSVFIESLEDVFRELRRTVSHWMDLTDAGGIFRPNLLRVRKNVTYSFPDIGTSSHFRMNMFTTESTFSITRVLDIVATVKCQDSFDKT